MGKSNLSITELVVLLLLDEELVEHVESFIQALIQVRIQHQFAHLQQINNLFLIDQKFIASIFLIYKKKLFRFLTCPVNLSCSVPLVGSGSQSSSSSSFEEPLLLVSSCPASSACTVPLPFSLTLAEKISISFFYKNKNSKKLKEKSRFEIIFDYERSEFLFSKVHFLQLTQIDLLLGRILDDVSGQFVLVVDNESVAARLALRMDLVLLHRLQEK